MKLILISILSLGTFSSFAGLIPQSFSARYENSWQSAIGGTKKQEGTLDYKYPSNVRLDVKSEPKLTLVTNKTTTWYYQPAFNPKEESQVSIQKSSSHPVIKFLDSMKDGFENSKYFSSKANANDMTLTFNEAGKKEFSFQEVVLHANKAFKDVTLKDIESIDLKDANGKVQKLRFLELKEGATFPSSHFIFNIPPKTKVIKG